MPNVFDQFDVDPKQQGAPKNIFDQFDAPKEEAPGLLESFGRGAAQGATFGFADDLGMSKERNEAAAKANPWAHFAGELAGGIAPTVAATLAAPEVAIPAGLAKAAPWLAKGYAAVRSAFVPGEIGTLGQAVGQGAKLGASYGALSGAGNADVNPDDSTVDALKKRATGALQGAATGTVGGGLLGGVGHQAYKGAQEIGGLLNQAQAETASGGQGALKTMVKGFERDRITPQTLIDQIRAEFPSDTATAGGNRFWGSANNRQPWTADMVEDVVRRAMNGETASDISSALSANGPGPGRASVQTMLDELASRHLGPLNIIDRSSLARTGAGQNTQMTMRAAAATPGDAQSMARENLLERQIGSGGRLQDLFARTVGNPNFDAVAAQHSKDLKDAGDRAYAIASANEQPFDLNPVFNKWAAKYGNMRGPIPDAIKSALNDLQTTQPVVDQAGNLVKNSGIVNQAPPMDLEGFINARGGLRDAIQSAAQAGKKNVASRLGDLYDDLTNEVAKSNPDWLKANQIWADGKAAQNALDAGASMSTRLNSSSRDNLKVFTDAQSDAAQAAKDLKASQAALKKFQPQAGTNPAQQTQLQAAVEGAQARLDAANTKQKLFKVGLVRALNEQIANQGETNNLTRQMLLPGAKKMLGTVLGNDADPFFKGLQAEAAMHRTYSSQFGSQTTPLREAVDELNWAPDVNAASWYSWLSPLHAAGNVMDLAAKYAARGINARRNQELMGLYTDTNPVSQLDILRQAQALHTARSNAGNMVGRPVVGSAAPLLNAFVGHESDLNTPTPAMTPYRP